MTDEIRKQFHQALDDVKAEIVHLGALAIETIPRATTAFLAGDLKAAQELIDADDIIDVKSVAIEEECTRLLALQQPMARDLRSLMTAVKLNWEIERSADLAVNIAKTVRRIYGVELPHTVRGVVEQMSEEAYRLTRLAVDSYMDLDVSIASALDDMDDRLDTLQVDLMRAIFDAHETHGLQLQPAVQLALIGRYYERIGDHAVNMGERVQYLVTGWLPEHTGVARAAMKSQGPNHSAADDASWS
jgi:phosphate transport system protein